MTYNKEWYDKNRQHVHEYQKQYRKDNPEKLRERDRKNHIKHRKSRNKYSLRYYYKNRARIRKQQKAHYERIKK